MISTTKKTRLPTIFGSLIILLSIFGISYAHWTDTLVINGNINTGSIDPVFTSPYSNIDDGNDWTCGPQFMNPDPEEATPPKDIGSSLIEVIDSKTLRVTLTDVYPCYYTNLGWHIRNEGTVPCALWKVIFTPDNNPAGKIEITKAGTYFTMDLDGDGKDDIEVNWGNSFREQLDPGPGKLEMSFEIHVLQDAPQGSKLPFTIELVFANWNEVVSSP
jgi:hypothetical protein